MSRKPKVDGVNRTDHVLYGTWSDMKRRCYDNRLSSYPNYGGRGITVCDMWLDDFANFAKDVGQRPEGTSLDRIDNNKGYAPSNVRWATRREQNGNTRAVINSCGAPGVSRSASGRFRARYKQGGKEVALGVFDTIKEASACVDKYKLDGIKMSSNHAFSKTGFRNVYYHAEHHYYYTQFTVNKVRHFGKVFKTAEEASEYVELAKANTNT